MGFDVTLGQYYETGSVIHRSDPRAKLFFMLLRQKVFLASFGQVKLASQDFKSSKYTSFINELFGRDRDLCTDVLNCNVFKVMLATRLQFTKNLIVNFLKRLNLYDRLKGALK